MMNNATVRFTDELDDITSAKRDEIFKLMFEPPKTQTTKDIAHLHELYANADECLSYYVGLCRQLVTCQAIIKQAFDKLNNNNNGNHGNKSTPATAPLIH